MFDEYRRSLKMPAAEELFDLAFYRPLAFVFVKAIYRLPVTPNQVTMASMISGLAAAWYFSTGTGVAFAWSAFWYAVANILDCADGQLARLQLSGTPLGRLVDGIADYISSVAIFLGIGAGLVATGQAQWLLVIAAGLSSAVHAMFFDHYQNEYLSIVRAEENFTEREVDKISSYLHTLESSSAWSPKILFLKLYLRYLAVQQKADTTKTRKQFNPETYCRSNALMIRIWSLLGPTTNRTLLIICALCGRIDIYLWGIVIIGNLWLGMSYLLQRNVHRSIEIQNQAGGLLKEIKS